MIATTEEVKPATGRLLARLRDRGPGGKSSQRVHPALYVFPLPAVVLLVVFMAIPLIQAFHYAITDWDGYSSTFNYVGLDNFVTAFTGDTLFLNAMTNNLQYMLAVVIVQTIVSLVLS